MSIEHSKQQRFLEIALIVICLALACVLYRVSGYKMVVLNLFFLPVVLGAFFLGRYRAGVLALFCVVLAAVATALDLANFAAYTSPLTIGLALTIWGGVLGLNAILVGTLSDERTQKITELHDAYVGVVEVMSRYLSSADPALNDRAGKVCALSQKVAARMKLSDKEMDDIRVAALLQDIENIEVTARVIRKAMCDLTHDKASGATEHTFHGSDLVQSLGSVLTGALPLLFDHGSCLDIDDDGGAVSAPTNSAMGAKVIRTVRSYLTLLSDDPGVTGPRDALAALQDDIDGEHHPAVLHALTQVVHGSATSEPAEEDHLQPVALA